MAYCISLVDLLPTVLNYESVRIRDHPSQRTHVHKIVPEGQRTLPAIGCAVK